jgi:hypothetical protein
MMDSPGDSNIPQEEPVPVEQAVDPDPTDELVPPAPPQAPPAPPAPAPAQAPEGLAASSERTWSMLAHLSILLNLFTGFLGPIVALVIYLVYKDRSAYVRFHAMQAFIFQLVFFVGAGALAAIAWLVSLTLSVVLVGCCCVPFAFLLTIIPVAALVYGVIGAIQTAQGDDFRYWLVDQWVLGGRQGPGTAY